MGASELSHLDIVESILGTRKGRTSLACNASEYPKHARVPCGLPCLALEHLRSCRQKAYSGRLRGCLTVLCHRFQDRFCFIRIVGETDIKAAEIQVSSSNC